MFEILIINEQSLRTGGPATLWDSYNERRVAKGCRLPLALSGVRSAVINGERNKFRRARLGLL